jgi:hypothetical protein
VSRWVDPHSDGRWNRGLKFFFPALQPSAIYVCYSTNLQSFLSSQEMRFSWQGCWMFKFCGMCHCVIGWNGVLVGASYQQRLEGSTVLLFWNPSPYQWHVDLAWLDSTLCLLCANLPLNQTPSNNYICSNCEMLLTMFLYSTVWGHRSDIRTEPI